MESLTLSVFNKLAILMLIWVQVGRGCPFNSHPPLLFVFVLYVFHVRFHLCIYVFTHVCVCVWVCVCMCVHEFLPCCYYFFSHHFCHPLLPPPPPPFLWPLAQACLAFSMLFCTALGYNYALLDWFNGFKFVFWLP